MQHFYQSMTFEALYVYDMFKFSNWQIQQFTVHFVRPGRFWCFWRWSLVALSFDLLTYK